MRRRDKRAVVAAIVAAVFVLFGACADAFGDPTVLRVKSPSTLTTEKGSVVTLPPGRFVDEESWSLLEVEFSRLQAVETRLGAENKSLRASATRRGPWLYVIGALAVGFASGVAYHVVRQ